MNEPIYEEWAFQTAPLKLSYREWSIITMWYGSHTSYRRDNATKEEDKLVDRITELIERQQLKEIANKKEGGNGKTSSSRQFAPLVDSKQKTKRPKSTSTKSKRPAKPTVWDKV